LPELLLSGRLRRSLILMRRAVATTPIRLATKDPRDSSNDL
jgi:hypothetical protein